MPDWKERFAALGIDFEQKVDALKLRLRQRVGSFENLQLVPYRGFGNSERIFLKGRVLKEFKLRASRETDRLWHNLLATFRRFHTVEIPGIKVVARLGENAGEAITDHEGYFDIELPVHALEPDRFWQDVKFEFGHSREGAGAHSEALIPPRHAEFGVISDIDDTVILSHLQNLPRLAYAVFMQNARARVVVPGVPEFYRSLHLGKQGVPANPIFYLSSGPWNLYDLLVEFLELNKIPKGPIFLQDYGIEHGKLFAATHRTHKGAQIKKIMEVYPDLPFVLIGDSGQHDPEIYCEVLQQAPNRIKAIYIRDVTEKDRREEIACLTQEVRKHGGELMLFQQVSEAVEHAKTRGLLGCGDS